jgi:hypothetical protein
VVVAGVADAAAPVVPDVVELALAAALPVDDAAVKVSEIANVVENGQAPVLPDELAPVLLEVLSVTAATPVTCRS